MVRHGGYADADSIQDYKYEMGLPILFGPMCGSGDRVGKVWCLKIILGLHRIVSVLHAGGPAPNIFIPHHLSWGFVYNPMFTKIIRCGSSLFPT
jgi:hypothetical protein